MIQGIAGLGSVVGLFGRKKKSYQASSFKASLAVKIKIQPQSK